MNAHILSTGTPDLGADGRVFRADFVHCRFPEKSVSQMTYIDRDHDFDFIAYPLSTPANLETWTMTIGSILLAFGIAFWAHVKFVALAVGDLLQ
jgi:hypothetical protein